MRLTAIVLGLWFVISASACSPLVAQQTRAVEGKIVIRVSNVSPRSGARSALFEKFSNGYRFSLSGQTIQYHSSDPDADSALLVRGQREAHSISWVTDPLPDSAAEYSQFIWLAGVECAGFAGENDVHSFDLLINNQLWFTFKNAKDSTARNWKAAGKDGAELSFSALVTDHVGDLFGYMVLKVPTSDFERRKPLTLEVRGDDSGSPDWYMTFQHPFNFVPQVRSEPALLKDGSQVSQILRLSIDNLDEGRTLEVDVPLHQPIRTELKVGANVLHLPIPAVTTEMALPVVFELDQKVVETNTVHVLPVKKRDFYLLSYSHNDIGYTDLQPDVERKQWNNIDEAMRLIRETRNYPPDAQYKWNLETIWALESYMRHASPAQLDEFFADVGQGRIGLSALYANMLTGLANATEMSHFFDFARRLREQYQIRLDTASTSDVPGFSWGLVSALQQSGIRYFATAPNSGDRIGYTLEAWGDKPFYWASRSGKEKVLFWMAGASYSSFHDGTLSKLGDEKIMKLARRLDDESYPYEIVQMPYTLGDNGPTDPTLSDFVRQWNERYVAPHLILATHEKMFQEFEKRYGSTLPVIQGDFTPYWEDGAASTAYETALSRAAVDRLIQGEALWSMLSPDSYPDEEYAAAWRNVAFYDEHTWGAHNSTEEPDLPFVKQQWEIKRKFALDADSASRGLLTKALRPGSYVAKSSFDKRSGVDVYNTNSWPRSDVVFLSPELSAAGDRVIGSDGNPILSQRLSSGELAVLVENVQPYSSKRLFIEKGNAYSRGGAKLQGTTIENEFIRLSVNPQTGYIDGLHWKKTGVELVDQTHPDGLNQYLYVLGTDPNRAQPIHNVRVHVKEQGDLVVSLLVEGDAPGARRYSSEIRLAAGIDRVDLITTIDKLAVREKEGVHIAFPFSVPDGQLRYDVADAVVRPEADQLTGACKNFFSVQSWVDVSNSQYGVTWATVNAPLIEVGAITAEQPWMKSISPSSRIYSYVMNNYWHTNYKANQEGPVTFTYSLLPHGAFNAATSSRFGTERRQPLIVASADSSSSPAPLLFRLSSPYVLVSSIKPIASGSWLVYIYNPSATAQKFSWQRDRGAQPTIYSSDASGQKGNALQELDLAAFDSAYIRVDRAVP